MPAKLTRCVEHVKAQGKPASRAWPICVESTGLKPHRKKRLGPDDTKEVMKRAKR